MTQKTTEDRLTADKWLDQMDTDAALMVMLDSQAEAIGALRTAFEERERSIGEASSSR